MGDKPQFSICIPVYNGEGTIARAITSALNQTYDGDYEIIVVDNASTDCTQEVVKPFISKGIRYHRNNKNIGMAGNWNRCIELANGEWVCLLPDDDIVLPTTLRIFANTEEKYPDVGMIFGKDINIDRINKEISFLPSIYDGARYFSKGMLVNDLVKRNFVGLSATVVRKSIYEIVGGFIADNIACDYHMWLLISALYPVAFVDRYMGIRYYDRSSISWGKSRKLASDTVALFGLLRCDKRLSDCSRLFKLSEALWSLKQTKSLIMRGQFSQGMECFKNYSKLSQGMGASKLRCPFRLKILLRLISLNPKLAKWFIKVYACSKKYSAKKSDCRE